MRDAPLFNNIKSSSEINLNQFKENVKNIIISMNNNYCKYDLIKLFANYLSKIYKNLKDQKDSIKEKLKVESWKDIQNTFEEVFSQNLNDFKNNLSNTIEELSKNIKEKYDEFYKLINEFLIIKVPSSGLLLKKFISQKLGREEISQSIEDIIEDIIKQSKNCTSWVNSKSTLKYLKTKCLNEDYLNNFIDLMIDNYIIYIKKLSENYYNYFQEFKMLIENEITVFHGVIRPP